MVNQSDLTRKVKALFLTAIIAGILMFIGMISQAQEMPPRPVGIYYTQSLSFGAFSLGISGGSVTVYPSGIRSSTGGVVLLNLGYPFFPAIFNIEGNLGTVIHPLLGPDVTLTGSSGGSLTLHLETTDPGDPIIISVSPPGQISVKVGGTIYVGNQAANPPGFYSGFFSIMFIQE